MPTSPAALLRDQLETDIVSSLPALLGEHAVPGIQLAVGFRGRIILSIAQGVTDRTSGARVSATTIFKAASLAKAVTALCTLRLIDRGLLALDAPFEQYTDWRFPPDRCHGHDPSAITIRRLLSHASGMDAAKFPQIPTGEPAPAAREILDGCFGPDLTPHIRSAPGSELRYAGSNFELLRLLIESVTGDPLSLVAAREVFTPLALTESMLGPPPAGTAVCPAHDARGTPLPDLFYPAIGSSGLFTTASDLARLWLAIGGAPLCNGRPLLSPPLRMQMLSPQATMPTGYAFGLGVAVAQWNERTLFKHAGIARGLFSMAEGTQGGSVVIMTNSDNGKRIVQPLVNSITGCIIAALNQNRPAPPAAAV